MRDLRKKIVAYFANAGYEQKNTSFASAGFDMAVFLLEKQRTRSSTAAQQSVSLRWKNWTRKLDPTPKLTQVSLGTKRIVQSFIIVPILFILCNLTYLTYHSNYDIVSESISLRLWRLMYQLVNIFTPLMQNYTDFLHITQHTNSPILHLNPIDLLINNYSDHRLSSEMKTVDLAISPDLNLINLNNRRSK